MSKSNYEEMLKTVEEASIGKQKKKKVNLAIISLISIITLGSLGAGYYVWNSNLNNNNSKVESTKKEIATPIDSSSNTEILEAAPLELPNWAKKSHLSQTENDIKEMIKYSNDNFIGLQTEIYPSTEDGFTSDPNKQYDEDGLPNEYYVVLTSEELNKQLSNIVYRITNPIFGEWSSMQYPSDRDISQESINLLQDISTAEFIDKYKENNGPKLFLFDYDKNNYNESFSNDNGATRFVGIIKDGSIVYNQDDTILIDMTVDFMKNQTEIFTTKKYKLNLKIEDKKVLLNGGEISE